VQVTLGIPSQGFWKDVMGLSLARALVEFPYNVHFSVQRGPYLDVNREACVTDALSAKSDYLAFVDTDMCFPPEALSALVERTKGKDILGANYYEKRLPLVSTVKLEEDGELVSGVRSFPREPFRVAAVGTGFMCVDLQRLVECLAPPFFSYAAQNGQFMGEDLAFCTRARKAGLSVWCDPTIELLHSGEYLYGPTPTRAP
jgi:hypothetical protein